MLLSALGPPERTLGAGIRWVYIHVAAVWAGLAWLAIAGLAGIGAIAAPARVDGRLVRAAGAAGMTLFSAGTLLSLAAARANWGGILWFEPRLVASAQVVALGALVLVVTAGLFSARIRGFLWGALAIFAIWATGSAGRVFHPRSPIQADTPWEIRATFGAVTALLLAAGGLLALARVAAARARGAEGAGTSPEG